MGHQVHDLDTLLKPLGGFGKFQIINIFCICSIILLCSFSELGYVFTAGELKHRCWISECEPENASYESKVSWLSKAIPTTSDEYDFCQRYNISNIQDHKCDEESFSDVDVYKCSAFIYETTEWTIAREDWNLHCDDDRYLLTLVGSLNNAGQVVGALFVGYLADRYGRKIIITIALCVTVLGVIKSFSVNYPMMVTFEMIEAMLAVALFNLPFVLALEIVDPSKRVLAGFLVSTAYPLGEMILGLVQYLTFDWRTTIRILYAPFVLTAAYYWIIPESVRWLLENNKSNEAVVILRKIAKFNKGVLPETSVKNILNQSLNQNQDTTKDEKETKNKFLQLWKSKIMRLRLVAALFVWTCNTFVFFGMTLNSVSLSSDKFLNFILTGLIEIPAYFLLYLILDKWGRKICQSASLLLCGVACIMDAFVPNDSSWDWAKLVLYLFGKFGISVSFFVIDVYTTEMFPTPIRSTMMSTGLMVGKLATIVAPEVPLLADLYEPLPLIIFGTLATASGFTALTFPETLNCKLPDTMEEAENLGRKKKQAQDVPL